MKKYFALLFLVLIGFSCKNNQTEIVEREGEPDVYMVDSDNNAMNRAIETAQKEYDYFLNAYEKQNEDTSDFSVKLAFELSDGTNEHMWVGDLFTKEDELFGILHNEPIYADYVSYEDTIKVVREKISDWQFIKNNKYQGAYTIQVHRKNMTPEELMSFDMQTDGLYIQQ